MEYLGSDEQKSTVARVEHELRLWSDQLLAAHAKLNGESGSCFRFLTIARDGGSLGDEIAQEISRRLGWHVFDKEIVTYIAENNKIRENLVNQLDQKAQGLIQDMISRFLRPESASFGVEEYHETLLQALACVAAHGSSILLGRGANFALREDKRGLYVRITASFEVRVKRLIESWKVNPEEARRRLQAEDKERREFIHQYFRKDFDDMRFYDLMFNTDHLSIEQILTSILPVIKGQKSKSQSNRPASFH